MVALCGPPQVTRQDSLPKRGRARCTPYMLITKVDDASAPDGWHLTPAAPAPADSVAGAQICTEGSKESVDA